MKISKIIGFTALIIFTILFIVNIIRKFNNKIELDKVGVFTICKVYKFNNHKRYQNYYYYYYFNDKKIYKVEDINFPKLGDYSVNKFYVLKHLKNNPEICKIFIDQEVTDTPRILSNGFKIDIKK